MSEDITGEEADIFWSLVQRCLHGASCARCCWLWQGATYPNGYGRYDFRGARNIRRRQNTHRLAWLLTSGNIPPAMSVLHRCDVPLCVNPAHLWLGTQSDNLRDMLTKGRGATGDRNGSRLHPERLPRGDNHPARINPAYLARGERHGSKTHPERIARGERHNSRTHPERLQRGEANGSAKLTAAQVQAIRALQGTRPQRVIAHQFGISQALVSLIWLGKIWQHLPNVSEEVSA